MNDFERLIKLLQDQNITFEADSSPDVIRRKVVYKLESSSYFYYFDKYGVLVNQEVKHD